MGASTTGPGNRFGAGAALFMVGTAPRVTRRIYDAHFRAGSACWVTGRNWLVDGILGPRNSYRRQPFSAFGSSINGVNNFWWTDLDCIGPEGPGRRSLGTACEIDMV